MGSFGNVEIENRVNVKINSKREEENKVCFGRKEYVCSLTTPRGVTGGASVQAVIETRTNMSSFTCHIGIGNQ